MQRKEKEGRKKLKYDPSDGLLPEIRKHCGYPDHIIEESSPRGSSKRKKQVEEEWKWVEAQLCGMCSAGGDILCCEGCPASFHLSCVAFESTDVPDESYYCNRCENLPKDANLFPPEKCAPVVSAQHRVEHENERNREAIEYHYNTSKQKEHAILLEQISNGEVFFGPSTERQTYNDIAFDELLMQSMPKANAQNNIVPSEFLLGREFYPNDSMEVKRAPITGETCAECNLKDDWTAMLNCDFCDLIWHQKCVCPPLLNIPRMNYWMCPRHTEVVIDCLLLGEIADRYERDKLYQKYATDEPFFEIFEKFCIATEPLRLEAKKSDDSKIDVIYPESDDDSFPSDALPSLPISRKTRKGGRGKKKNNESLSLISVYSLKTISDKLPKTLRKTSPSERKDGQLDDLDKQRSVKFTKEELTMSILPRDCERRKEYLTQKMLGTDIDFSTSFFTRHTAMIARSHHFYSNFSEKELIKLMRRDLDPIETVRGGGIQCIVSVAEKTYRKKLKADVELLVQLIGFGNEHQNRKFNSFRTEAFFRRCAPPPSAKNVLNQKTLREVALNSQKEALEISKVYRYHPIPDQLENFVLLAYNTHFESAQERDSYFPSSMTIWSKEPIAALLAKWTEKHVGVRDIEKSSTPESVADSSIVGDSIAEESSRSPEDNSNQPDEEKPVVASDIPSRSETPVRVDPVIVDPESKVEEEQEEKVKEKEKEKEKDEERTITPAYENDTGPLEDIIESTYEMIDRLALGGFKEIKKPEFFEKCGSFDALDLLGPTKFFGSDNMRKCKSTTNLIYVPDWNRLHDNIQSVLYRDINQPYSEHSYAMIGLNKPLDTMPDFQRIPFSIEDYYPDEESIKDTEESIRDDDSIRESPSPSEFLSPKPPDTDGYENFVDISKKRGRPKGSKNRTDGEGSKSRRSSVGSTSSVGSRGRGRGGRPRGSRGGRRIAGGGESSAASSIDGGGPSRRASMVLSSDGPESPDPSTPTTSKTVEDEVEAARQKYAKMLLRSGIEKAKDNYFKFRDEALETWTTEQWDALQKRVLAARLSSLIPFEPRYLLPSQRVLARLVVDDDHLPIAIQRCLTKFGTAHDCHIRTDKAIRSFCAVLADYHCDIIREYHSDQFFLSTLATETVIVDDVVVRRPRLIELEAAERTRTKEQRGLPSGMKCRCQKYSDQLLSHQENTGVIVTTGIIKLNDGAQLRIGCSTFTFHRN
ncbi:unnamed protein product [Caenorhabditis nigoni]